MDLKKVKIANLLGKIEGRLHMINGNEKDVAYIQQQIKLIQEVSEMLPASPQPKPDEWKSQGELFKIKDMCNAHLINTIKYLLRNKETERQDAIRAGYMISGGLSGEMARYQIECSIQDLEETDAHKILLDECPPYSNMIKEASRRCLLWT
ncbi:MAG: hypothetical protein KAJ24_00870 [Candidatus Aenigmarchaeota archaeon]|nr:hypothetical protein [Candidatus Aenigmarchaeota archaeon]